MGEVSEDCLCGTAGVLRKGQEVERHGGNKTALKCLLLAWPTARLPLWCNWEHPGGCSALCCLSVSLKSYYGCWKSLQWRKTWVSPSLPAHAVPSSSRRVFLAWLHARGSLYTKQPGKVHTPTETDESGLAGSNESNRVFGILFKATLCLSVISCNPLFSMGNGAKTTRAWAKLQIFQLHSQSCKFTKEIPFYMEPEFKIEANFISVDPMHFLGKLACFVVVPLME